jgi:hypothetical protein
MSYQDILGEINGDLAYVEKELHRHARSSPTLLGESSECLVQAGGKRLRPSFVVSGGTGILEALAYNFIHGTAANLRMRLSSSGQFHCRLTGFTGFFSRSKSCQCPDRGTVRPSRPAAPHCLEGCSRVGGSKGARFLAEQVCGDF